MPFKFNIGAKNSRTFKIEAEAESLIGKKIGESVSGGDIDARLNGYEFEITGTSDKAGFPGLKSVEGASLKKVLLTYGTGMKKLKPRGLRLKKTVRGNTISKDSVQINLKVVKEGDKKLEEIFPEQAKSKEENKESKPEIAKPEQQK